MMQAAQLTFSNLPLVVMAIAETKEVAIVRKAGTSFWDEGEPAAFFAADRFVISGQWYEYEKTYSVDANPELVKWLRRQSFQLVAVQEVVKVI